MLARLTKRLSHASHRLDKVLLAHVESRRHLLGGLIGHRTGV
jgi:hypothetical protein